jgi:hypothetical protein
VICERHGASTGVLCCRHVCQGARKRAGPLAFDSDCIDWLEDGSTTDEALVCDACAGHFGLAPHQPQCEAPRDDGADLLSQLCPACPHCLAEWQPAAFGTSGAVGWPKP